MALSLFVTCLIPFSSQAAQKWPKTPQVAAPSYCVMDISTGTILYENNMDEVNYPASITKIMTALLAVENCSLDEVVTFSEEAVYGNEGDTSHISRDIGEEMTMEECLYGMMLESANECAWAIGEHVAAKSGGTMEDFAAMMNERAAALGCTNTHFNNPNGLPDENHWTSAHDMALIAAEAYKNETFRVITGTKSYTIPPTNKHTDETPLHNHHKMIYPFHGDYAYLYDYSTGGKTGYTNAAGNTLVSYASKDGISLVCVVMREQTPNHYVDTRTLFDACFEQFQLLRIADYVTEDQADSDHQPFASLDEDAYVILPADAQFSDLESELVYDAGNTGVIGTFVYTYANREVGRAIVSMNDITDEGYVFQETQGAQEAAVTGAGAKTDAAEEGDTSDNRGIHIVLNAKTILLALGVLLVIALLIMVIVWLVRNSYLIRQRIASRRSRRMERRRYRTIRDTRKGRRRRRQEKKSKHLRF